MQSDFENVLLHHVRACVYVCVRPSVFPSPAISKTSEVIAIKFDTVTASVTRMHHVLIILTLTFIQGHTDLLHENNQYSIISETVQAMPIKVCCAMSLVRRKVYIMFSHSDDLDLHSRSQLRFKLDNCFTTTSDTHSLVSVMPSFPACLRRRHERRH